MSGFFAKVLAREPPRISMLRLVAVIGFLWVTMSAIPHVLVVDLSNPRQLNLVTDYDGRIRMGAGTGQKVDFRAIVFEDRDKFTPARPPMLGDDLYKIPLVGSGSIETGTTAYFDCDRVSVTLRFIASVVFVIVAGIALWRIPTRRTFSLFLFVVGANPVALNARLSGFPSATPWLVDTVVTDVLTSLAFLGIVDFAVHGEHRGSFASLWDKALPVLAPFYCIVNTWPDVATLAYGIPSEFINRLGFAAQFGITGYGGAALTVAAVRTPRLLRNPMIGSAITYWVGVGGYVVAYALLFSSIFSPLPDNVTDALQSSALFLFFSIFAGSTIIRRLAMLRSTLQRRISIGVIIQLLVTAAWFAIIRWLEAFGKTDAPVDVWTFAVLEVVGSVFWERTALRSVESQLAAVREARRKALEGSHAYLDAAVGEDEVDRALLSIGRELELQCMAVYRIVSAEYEAVAVLHCTASEMPKVSTTDKIVQRLRRGSEIKLAGRNVFASAEVSMGYGFALRRQRELIGFVVTSAHQDGKPLDDLDVLEVKYFILRAEMNYARLAKLAPANV